MFMIKSHWNYQTARLDGKTYETKDEAVDALGDHATVVEPYDDETEAYLAYSSQEDAEANAEGAAPHLCSASIVYVRKPR